MNTLFLASKTQRASWRKVCAGVMALSLNLSLGGLGGVLLGAQVAYATQSDLTITCDSVSISGNTWTLSGTWQAIDFGGQSTQYDSAVFSPSGTLSDGSSKDSPDAFAITQGPSNFGGVANKDDIRGTWSNQVVFGAVPSAIAATLYHAQVPGNETSGDATCSFTIPDTVPPVINMNGTSPVSVEQGTTYTDAGATASDDVDGDITANIVTVNPVNTATLGAYTVTYNVSDTAGNPATEVSRTVNVVDTTAPTVAISAPADGSTSGSSGSITYTASDGTVTCTIDTVASSCTSFSGLSDGSHTLVVTATDGSGNSGADSVTWTVDTTGPTVTITSGPADGSTVESTSATFGFTSPESGITFQCWIDALSSGCTSPTTYTGLSEDTHTFSVRGIDAYGNVGPTVSRSWTVFINDAPVITLSGLNPLNLILGIDVYSEPGATADDAEDGTGLTVTDITGAVNSYVIGAYEVLYNFIDTNGLAATEVSRTVNVNPGSTQCSDGANNDNDALTDLDDPGCESYSDDTENQPPVISVTGTNPLEIVVNVGSYSEEGATADDAEDGTGLTVTNIDASAVNVGAVGSYSVLYNYTDLDGAPATQAMRTVNVVAGDNECNDTIDNDGDGNVDGADSGCSSVDDTSENTPPEVVVDTEMLMLTLNSVFAPPTDVHATDVEDVSVTVDVLDNPVDTGTIGDYTVTYGATDSDGASAAPQTQTVKVRAECGDTIDNDDDGRTDAEDPACHTDGDSTNEESYDPTLVDESNDPECDDGMNNDGDEMTDSEDTGCSSPSDDSENIPPVIEPELLAMTLTTGDAFVMPDYTASDDEDGDLTEDVEVGGDVVDTNTAGTYEVTLDVADNDGASADTVTITVTVEDPPQDVCPDDEGIQTSTEECTPPPPSPACSDESDNDQDGKTDMEDPGCSSPEDNDETDPVAPPPGGGGGGGIPPQCANGSDDDADGKADYPNDGGCESSQDNDESGSGTPPAEPPTVSGGTPPPEPPPAGEVLGAATEEMPLPAGCTAYLSAYLKKGRASNKPEEVKLLQTFLNEEMNAGLPITGYFGNMTHSWVKKFQVKYKKDILQPWIDAGYGDMDFGNNGTGYVYKTTKRAINMMKCAEIAEPMPELVPDTSGN